MFEKINPIEKKEEKKRLKFALFFSIVFHVIFILSATLYNLADENKREEEIKVVTVQLHDKIIEDFNKLEDSKKQKIIEKNREEIKKSVKKIVKERARAETKSKQADKITEKKETVKDLKDKDNFDNKNDETKNKSKEISVDDNKNSENKEEQKTVKENIFDKYAEETKKSKDEIEKDFLSKNISDKEKTGFDDGKNELDNLLENIKSDTEKGNGGKTTEKNNGKDGNIKWEGGVSRKLLLSNKITPPDEIAILGLKTDIVVRFEVFSNGLIGSAVVVESTGNTLWDMDIIEQFKRNYKFIATDNKSIGIIQIAIGY